MGEGPTQLWSQVLGESPFRMKCFFITPMNHLKQLPQTNTYFCSSEPLSVRLQCQKGRAEVDLAFDQTQKDKQKSPGRATSRSRSQPLTTGGREKVTQINVCIANNKCTISTKTSSLFPMQGDQNAKRTEETHRHRAGQDQT